MHACFLVWCMSFKMHLEFSQHTRNFRPTCVFIVLFFTFLQAIHPSVLLILIYCCSLQCCWRCSMITVFAFLLAPELENINISHFYLFSREKINILNKYISIYVYSNSDFFNKYAILLPPLFCSTCLLFCRHSWAPCCIFCFFAFHK